MRHGEHLSPASLHALLERMAQQARVARPGDRDDGLVEAFNQLSQLWETVYPRARAALHRLRTAGGHGSALQPTAVLHDMYLRHRDGRIAPGILRRAALNELSDGLPTPECGEESLLRVAERFLLLVILLQARTQIAEARRTRRRRRVLDEGHRQSPSQGPGLFSEPSASPRSESDEDVLAVVIRDVAWLHRHKSRHCDVLIRCDALGVPPGAIAEELGLSVERVRQIRKEAKDLLAHRAEVRATGGFDDEQ